MSLKVTCIPTNTGGTGLDVYSRNLLDALHVKLKNLDVRPNPSKEISFMGKKVGGYISRFAWNLLGSLPKDSDVIHSFDILNLHRKSDVLTVHDMYVFDHPEHYGIGSNLLKRWMKRIEDIPAIIANSHYTKRRILQHFDVPPSKIRVTHLAPNPFYHYHERMQQDYNTYHVLMVGDLKPTKDNLATVLALRDLDRPVAVHRVGPDPSTEYGKNVIRKLEESGYMFWDYGYVDQHTLLKLYNYVDVLAFPSTDEGFGLPALEAARCGTPTVVSDHPVFRETLGTLGVFHANLTEAFRIARDEPPSKESLIEWSRKFSWILTAEKTFKVYKKVQEVKA